MQERVGFVGLGMMGLPMARRLLQEGYRLSVFNRTKEKAAAILSEGASWCEDSSAVAGTSDIVFSMVSDPAALREVSLGDRGVLRGLGASGIHVDTSTVSPALVRELAQLYADRGKHFLHAPVLGSVAQASEGTLLIFAGGSNAAYMRSEMSLKVLGKRIWKFDRPEQATHAKLLCNLFIAGMITTLGQALVLADKADVTGETLLEIIGQSQLNAPTYQTKGSSILQGNFAPRFYLEHMLKDINLMIDAARDLTVSLPTIQVAQQLFAEAKRAGLGKEDYSAVVKVLQKPTGH